MSAEQGARLVIAVIIGDGVTFVRLALMLGPNKASSLEGDTLEVHLHIIHSLHSVISPLLLDLIAN